MVTYWLGGLSRESLRRNNTKDNVGVECVGRRHLVLEHVEFYVDVLRAGAAHFGHFCMDRGGRPFPDLVKRPRVLF